ncbi:MAG: NYN domain-containing protein [Spirochaetota bacterium]|nr:MAG: NYN domain-containing protein [Spirochaetota bacterium]
MEGIPHYIIDGYNVILGGGFSSEREDVDDARESFLVLLDSYSSKKRVELTVVWDGNEPAGRRKRGARRVRSIYARGIQSADERIVKMVEDSSQRGRITVVSDDRRHITSIVKSLGAQVMGTREFLSLIRHAPSKRLQKHVNHRKDEDEKKEAVDDLSVEDWMQLFRSRSRNN